MWCGVGVQYLVIPTEISKISAGRLVVICGVLSKIQLVYVGFVAGTCSTPNHLCRLKHHASGRLLSPVTVQFCALWCHKTTQHAAFRMAKDDDDTCTFQSCVWMCVDGLALCLVAVVPLVSVCYIRRWYKETRDD